jgi:hypothetical protein
MEEKTNMRGSSGVQESTVMAAEGDSHPEASRRGPGWKGWVLSILVAILLSVASTLLLGGYGSFRIERATTSGAAGSGTGPGYGSSCCPPADAGK